MLKFRHFSLFLFSCAAIGLSLNVSAQVTDSMIPIMENIENNPPKKYSENYLKEINEALANKDQKIRVVSFNILFDLFDDQLEDKTQSWQARLPGVIEAVENMQPDILCLQEPYSKQLDDLKKRLNDFACFVGNSTTGELNAIFYKKSRFEIDLENYGDGLSSASLALPMNPSDEALVAKIPDFLPPELEPGKQLTLVHLRDKLSGKNFAVLNTHLTFFRLNSREDQARFITGIVQKLHDLNKPVIFTGDLNTLPNRPDLQKSRFLDGDHICDIFQEQLKDTKDTALLGHVGPISTFTKDFTKPDAKVFGSTGTPGVILDHIFVSREVTVIVNATEPCRADGQFPSDHMPVIADILLP